MSFKMSVSSEKSYLASSLLCKVDREFQNAREAYERWMIKSRKRRSSWQCMAGSSKEDPLERALGLGRHVKKAISDGKEAFGSRFEKGDTTTHTILTAQLLRIKHEITLPLLDCMESRISIIHIHLPYDAIISAALGIRRALLNALHDQLTRLRHSTRTNSLTLPPPRFSVQFCPYAVQLQTDKRQGHLSVINARKLHPKDKHDEREICPGCHMQVAITAHSGLPNYRRLLFTSHTSQPPSIANREGRATFACESCYKTFDESYAFLDHVFQKEIGSERSCLTRWSAKFILGSDVVVELGGDAEMVEKCLRNCLQREMTRRGEGKAVMGSACDGVPPNTAVTEKGGDYSFDFEKRASLLTC